jgi:glycosyltransferase involved in cell wall biosynthesis
MAEPRPAFSTDAWPTPSSRALPRILIVTDIFPPVNAVGTRRTVALCRHLAAQGWGVTVLTARPGEEEAIDPALLAQVPAEVAVIRTAVPDLARLAKRLLRRPAPRPAPATALAAPGSGTAAPAPAPAGSGPATAGAADSGTPGERRRGVVDWLSHWLKVPDGHLGWLLPAVAAGLRAGRRVRPDVIYGTAPKWTSQLVALTLSRLLRVPLVADFRDPWCGSAWRALPYAAHRRIDQALERRVVRRAAAVTCAWDLIRVQLAARYPERAADIRTIYNGFDVERADALVAAELDGGRCVLLHAGTFYGPRRPHGLFAGLRRLLDERPGAAGQLVLALLGSPAYDGRALLDIAREHGVEHLVQVVPPAPHDQALSYLKGAEVAVLCGQSGNAALVSVPGKVYEYVALGKPVLAIGAGDEAVGILRDGGCQVWRVDDEPEQIAAALAEVADRHAGGRLAAAPDPERRRSISWAARTRALEGVLAAAAGGR